MVIAPLPSMFGGRDSSRTTWSCWSCSSTASSMVTIRSPSGMNDESTLSSVVLPVPVPPETITLSRASTQALSSSAISGESVPKPIRSSTVNGSLANLRMVSVEPLKASGGMIALTREPSDRRASTSGEDSSIRRPTLETIRSMTRRRCSSEVNRAALQLEPAVPLDVDPLGAVDHDLGDTVVVEQPLQRPETQHVVGQLRGEPLPLLGRQRHLLLVDDLVELAEDDLAQLLLGQARVVEPGAHPLEQRLADPVLEPARGRRSAAAGGGTAAGGRGAGTAAGACGAAGGIGRPWAAARRSARFMTPPGAWRGGWP